MSLSDALSLESLSPQELLDISTRDMSELVQVYDINENGLLDLTEFQEMISTLLDRMSATLPAALPAKYCAAHQLPASSLDGVERRIADRFKNIHRAGLAKKLFTAIDTTHTGGVTAAQVKEQLHGLMEKYMLKEMTDACVQMIVHKLMAAYDKV